MPKQTNKCAKIQNVIGSAIGWIETFGDWSFGTKLVAKTSAQMWNLKAVFVRMMYVKKPVDTENKMCS